jgi:hypothetical protein
MLFSFKRCMKWDPFASSKGNNSYKREIIPIKCVNFFFMNCMKWDPFVSLKGNNSYKGEITHKNICLESSRKCAKGLDLLVLI